MVDAPGLSARVGPIKLKVKLRLWPEAQHAASLPSL